MMMTTVLEMTPVLNIPAQPPIGPNGRRRSPRLLALEERRRVAKAAASAVTDDGDDDRNTAFGSVAAATEQPLVESVATQRRPHRKYAKKTAAAASASVGPSIKATTASTKRKNKNAPLLDVATPSLRRSPRLLEKSLRYSALVTSESPHTRNTVEKCTKTTDGTKEKRSKPPPRSRKPTASKPQQQPGLRSILRPSKYGPPPVDLSLVKKADANAQQLGEWESDLSTCPDLPVRRKEKFYIQKNAYWRKKMLMKEHDDDDDDDDDDEPLLSQDAIDILTLRCNLSDQLLEDTVTLQVFEFQINEDGDFAEVNTYSKLEKIFDYFDFMLEGQRRRKEMKRIRFATRRHFQWH